MLVDQVEREGPAKREANLKTLGDQVMQHQAAGNLMHLYIYRDALEYLNWKYSR